MSVLVVGLSHRSAPGRRAGTRRRRRRRRAQAARRDAARRARLRGDAALDVQPHRGLRGRRRVPRRPRRRLRRARAGTPACRCPSSPSTSTCTTRARPCSTCSRWRRGSTRWSSARRRSSASCAPPTPRRTSAGTVGRVLHELAQQALRVGKRVHAEHRHRRRGRLRRLRGARRRRPPRARRARGAARRDRRRGGDGRARRGPPAPRRRAEIVVLNRTLAERAERLAENTARARHARPAPARSRRSPPSSPPPTCWWPAPARSARSSPGRWPRHRRPRRAPARVCDLGLPRDVDPGRRRRCPASRVIDLATLQRGSRRRRPRRRRRARAGAGRRGGAGLPGRPALGRGHAHRHRAAPPRLRGHRRRAAAPGLPPARARPRGARGVRAQRPPGRRQAAAHPDRAGEAAGRGPGRRQLRRPRCAPCSSSTRRPPRPSRCSAPATCSAALEARARRPAPGAMATDERPADRHPAQRAGHGPVRAGRRAAARRRATRSSWSRSPPRATGRRRRSPSSASACSSPRCATRSPRARSTSPCTPTRTSPPHPTPGSCWPPSRRGRTRATRWSPATAWCSASCPPEPRVGTGSPRRTAQLEALGLGLDVVPIRGNVDTRVGKVALGRARRRGRRRGRAAPAGPHRRGRPSCSTPLQMLPAPAQGALAVECRADDHDLAARSPQCSTTNTPARPSPRNGRCWPRWRPAAARRSGALADVVSDLTTTVRVVDRVSLRAVVGHGRRRAAARLGHRRHGRRREARCGTGRGAARHGRARSTWNRWIGSSETKMNRAPPPPRRGGSPSWAPAPATPDCSPSARATHSPAPRWSSPTPTCRRRAGAGRRRRRGTPGRRRSPPTSRATCSPRRRTGAPSPGWSRATR